MHSSSPQPWKWEMGTRKAQIGLEFKLLGCPPSMVNILSPQLLWGLSALEVG